MKFIELALKNRTLTWFAFVFTMLLGLLAFQSLSRREDPDLDGRFYQIIVKVPGADATNVEQLVSDRIERAILELDDTKIVESTSRPGLAILRIEPADRAKDLGTFTRKLRARVDDLRKELPSQVQSIDVNDRFSDTAAMIIAVSRPNATPRELEDYARKIRTQLRMLDQVANADLVGEPHEQFALELDSSRLAQYGISSTQIFQTVAAQNNYPNVGGGIDVGAKHVELQTSGQLSSLTQLKAIPLTSQSGSSVRVQDLATVKLDYEDPPSSIFRVNGQRAVAVSLTMRKGLDLTKFGDAVRFQLDLVRRQLPEDAKVQIVNDLPSSVKDRIGEFAENLSSGILLIAVVTFLFMGVRSAIIVGLSLPITVIGIFLLMKLLNRDIQQISVAALIISLGLVVDNSIVVIDNIERKLSKGLDRPSAVLSGTLELYRPLIASNLTTLGAFAPFAFISGGKGDFVKDLGLITSVSTLVSLVFNFTIIPLLAGILLKPSSGQHLGWIQRQTVKLFDHLNVGISRVAHVGLRRAGITLLAAFIALGLSASQIPRLGQQFFPGALRNQFAIDIQMPEGTGIRSTEETVKAVEAIISGRKDIVSFASYVGEGSPRFYYNFSPEAPASSIAQIVVNTASNKATTEMIPELQRQVNREVPGATIIVKGLVQGPPQTAPIAIRLSGSRIEDLRASADIIRRKIRSIPGSGVFFDDFRETRTSLDLVVDEKRANDAGLTSGEVLEFANLAYASRTITKFRDGDREIPVVIKLDASERMGDVNVEDIYVPSRNGNPVRLGDIAQQRVVGESARVVRRNSVRTLTLFGYSDGTRSAISLTTSIWEAIKDIRLPGGVTASYAGDKLESELSFAEIGAMSALGVLFNILVVAWLFPNWRVVSAITLATPLSLIGGIAGLLIAHQPFGFMALLGIVSLSGVVTNHTIVLFEYAHEGKKAGLSEQEALLNAGKERFRPILLTVLLSIMGLIPQAVNGGSLWPPLAYALIFGLLVSLLLTLVVIPSAYVLFTKVGRGKADAHLLQASDL